MNIKKDFLSFDGLSFNGLNPIDHGTYYIITCPKCGHHEAFVFKDDIIAAQKNKKQKIRYRCNRLNKCGATGWINLNGDSLKNVEVKLDESTGISEKALLRFQSLYEYGKVKDFDFSLRGISNQTLKENKVMYWPFGFQDFLYTSDGKLEKRFASKAYDNRDIMFPIVDKNNNIQRLLLRRSGRPVKQGYYSNPNFKHKKAKKDLKEIQVRMVKRPKTEIFNLKDVYDQKLRFIVMCEGAFDALSIKEAAYQNHINDVGAIGVPGSRKIKKTLLELIKNPAMKGKTIVIASDNDKAGKEAREKCLEIAKKENIKILFYNLHSSNDLNEFLCKKRKWFINDFRVQRRQWIKLLETEKLNQTHRG